jgi:hypothetical protein
MTAACSAVHPTIWLGRYEIKGFAFGDFRGIAGGPITSAEVLM